MADSSLQVWKMKALIITSFFILLACSTPGVGPIPHDYALNSFDAIPLGSSSEILEKSWGQPCRKGDYNIEGVHFKQWEYGDVSIASHGEGTEVPVAAIAMDTPELVDLRFKEEQNRRCWH
jgi:hypothetical protein